MSTEKGQETRITRTPTSPAEGQRIADRIEHGAGGSPLPKTPRIMSAMKLLALLAILGVSDEAKTEPLPPPAPSGSPTDPLLPSKTEGIKGVAYYGSNGYPLIQKDVIGATAGDYEMMTDDIDIFGQNVSFWNGYAMVDAYSYEIGADVNNVYTPDFKTKLGRMFLSQTHPGVHHIFTNGLIYGQDGGFYMPSLDEDKKFIPGPDGLIPTELKGWVFQNSNLVDYGGYMFFSYRLQVYDPTSGYRIERRLAALDMDTVLNNPGGKIPLSAYAKEVILTYTDDAGGNGLAVDVDGGELIVSVNKQVNKYSFGELDANGKLANLDWMDAASEVMDMNAGISDIYVNENGVKLYWGYGPEPYEFKLEYNGELIPMDIPIITDGTFEIETLPNGRFLIMPGAAAGYIAPAMIETSTDGGLSFNVIYLSDVSNTDHTLRYASTITTSGATCEVLKEDRNQCTLDDCYVDPTTKTFTVLHTPLENGTLCTDATFAHGGQCTDGICTPIPGPCDNITCDTNGNICQTGACDESTGECVYSNVMEGEICRDSLNQCTHSTCVSGNCEESNLPDDTKCDDGDIMTTDDKCDGNGLCVGQDPCLTVTCDAGGNLCVTVECVNNEGVAQCISIPVDEGTFCGETGTVCTGMACDGLGGCQTYFNDGQDCDDGNPATIEDQCDQGLCKGQLPPEPSTENDYEVTEGPVENDNEVVEETDETADEVEATAEVETDNETETTDEVEVTPEVETTVETTDETESAPEVNEVQNETTPEVEIDNPEADTTAETAEKGPNEYYETDGEGVSTEDFEVKTEGVLVENEAEEEYPANPNCGCDMDSKNPIKPSEMPVYVLAMSLLAMLRVRKEALFSRITRRPQKSPEEQALSVQRSIIDVFRF